MLAPPPPPTPPYAMSESSAQTGPDLDELLAKAQAARANIMGPYGEGELRNLPYPYSSNAADGLPHEASQFRRDARPTRREVEARIREQERMLANRETGANKELFMIRRTKLYRLYHGSLANLPQHFQHRPPPLPGQKDTRGKKILKELPPLRGVRPKDLPPPPPPGPGGPPHVAFERPATPVLIDYAEAERLRRAEEARLRQEAVRQEVAAQHARDVVARDLVTGMRGVQQFHGLAPDFSRLAVLQDLARRANTATPADMLDDSLDLTVHQLASKAKAVGLHRPWDGIWRVGKAA